MEYIADAAFTRQYSQHTKVLFLEPNSNLVQLIRHPIGDFLYNQWVMSDDFSYFQVRSFTPARELHKLY